MSDNREALLMAIGTVYGPPPTRNSGPGVVTLTWGVAAGVVDSAAAGGFEAGGVEAGGPEGDVDGDAAGGDGEGAVVDGGVPTPVVGGTGRGAAPGVCDVNAGDGCENPGGFGSGGGGGGGSG